MKTLGSSAAFTLACLSFTAGCGIESSLVGGRCRDGMELSGNTCVAPAPGGTLVAPTDPPGDAKACAPPSSVSGVVDGPSRDPDYTGRPPALVAPEPIEPEQPIGPYVSPVDPVTPVTPPELVCEAPLVACHGMCISVTSDAANCGACGKICPSNICIDGVCQGATPGDVVLIGHDYTSASEGSAQAKVLVNALSIPTTDPIRVLSYEDGAPQETVAQAKAVAVAGIHGRTVRFTKAPSASTLAVATLAKSYDIVLIHDASAGDATDIGASGSTSLGDFTMKGGVVVALDRGTSPMPKLLSSAGLLAVTSHTTLPDATHLVVTAAADVVGAQVLSPYAGFGAPVSFQGIATPSTELGWVVRWADSSGTLGDPVVVHRIVR